MIASSRGPARTGFAGLAAALIILSSDFARAAGQNETTIVRQFASYAAPAVTLLDASRQSVRFDQLLAEDRPVILQFIFTSCTTICGVMASTLAAASEDLANLRKDYVALTVTIDPEYDTPERLREFAEYFPANPHWRLLTGRPSDVAEVLKAFDAQFAGGLKMNHQAYTFLRAAPNRPWLRIEGLIGPRQLVAEYKSLFSDENHSAR